MKTIDLTGQKFGKLTVLRQAQSRNGNAYWVCQCECGTVKEIRGGHLRSGKIISCGCQGKKNLGQKIDLTGQKFGRLTVLKEHGKDKYGAIEWLCQCDCGKQTIVTGNRLRSGHTKSCGCLNKEQITQLGKENAIDLTGQRFGKLTALYPTDKRIQKCVVWHCQCDCGNEYDVSSYLLTSGKVSSCGCLGRSMGEEKIEQILKENNIPFEKEKRFSSCYNPTTKKLLRFDFYIDNQYLVEFDGEQHYKATSGWNDEERLIITKERDEIKNKWCKENNIPLIRIPYTQLKKLNIQDLLLQTSTFIYKE